MPLLLQLPPMPLASTITTPPRRLRWCRLPRLRCQWSLRRLCSSSCCCCLCCCSCCRLCHTCRSCCYLCRPPLLSQSCLCGKIQYESGNKKKKKKKKRGGKKKKKKKKKKK